MKSAQLKLLSNLCFVLGFASILGSIAIWFLTGGQATDTQAHAERFGIFVRAVGTDIFHPLEPLRSLRRKGVLIVCGRFHDSRFIAHACERENGDVHSA